MASSLLCAAGAVLALLIGCSSEPAPGVDAAGATSGAGGTGAGGNGSAGSGGSPGAGGGSAGGPPAWTGDALWARRGDGLGASRAVAAHPDGSLAVVGDFRDTIDFGAGPMTSAGEIDMFVARFDENGTCTWSRSFGGPSNDGGNSVAIDAAGDVILTGGFQGTIQVGAQVLASTGSYDIPVIKLDSQGNPVWAMSFGGLGFDVAYSLAVSPAGSLAVMGASAGPIDFGGGVLQGTESTFVVKLAGDGTHLWSRMLDRTQGNAVTVDQAEHVALGGDFSGTIDLGTGPLTSQASTDSFVARFDPAGNTVFSDRVGDGSSMNGYSVAASPTSDVILGGMAQSQGVTEAFVTLDRFTAQGGLVWNRKYGVAEYAAANAIAVDSFGHVVAAGFFRHGTLDFGCGPLDSAFDQGNDFAGDMFLAKLDASGACIWSKTFGGWGQQSAFGTAVDGTDHIVIAGEFQDAIDFGLGPLVAKHYPEPCVARFTP